MKIARRVALGALLSCFVAAGSMAANADRDSKLRLQGLQLSEEQMEQVTALHATFSRMAEQGLGEAEFNEVFEGKAALLLPASSLAEVRAFLHHPLERAQTIVRIQQELKLTLSQASLSVETVSQFIDSFEGVAIKTAITAAESGDAQLAQDSYYSEIVAPLRADGLRRADEEAIAKLFAARVAAE